MGLLPISDVLTGWLSDSFGLAAVFFTGASLMVILNSFPLFLRAIRESERCVHTRPLSGEPSYARIARAKDSTCRCNSSHRGRGSGELERC